jgi:hypothetical protein
VREDHVTDISSLREIYAGVTDQSHDLRAGTYIHVPGPRENPDASAGPACSVGEFVSYPLTLSLGVGFAQNGCGSPNERQEENAEGLPTDQ